MTTEPVVVANAVAALVSAAIVALVALGYLPWDETQQAAVMGVVVAAVNVIAAVWTRQRTTPLTEPRDIDGAPLTRPNNSPALPELERLMKEAQKEDALWRKRALR